MRLNRKKMILKCFKIISSNRPCFEMTCKSTCYNDYYTTIDKEHIFIE